MLNVGLDVQIVLGQARMPISRLLELTRGSIVELNRKIGAPVDLMVSDRLVARGDLGVELPVQAVPGSVRMVRQHRQPE